jgi:hypothetical protein
LETPSTSFNHGRFKNDRVVLLRIPSRVDAKVSGGIGSAIVELFDQLKLSMADRYPITALSQDGERTSENRLMLNKRPPHLVDRPQAAASRALRD